MRSLLRLLLILIVTVIVLCRKISPINQVVAAADKIVQGDLDVSLTVKSNNEIGVLARSFTEMSSSLREIISDVGYLLGEMAQGNFLVETHCAQRYVGDYGSILQAAQSINTRLVD